MRTLVDFLSRFWLQVPSGVSAISHVSYPAPAGNPLIRAPNGCEIGRRTELTRGKDIEHKSTDLTTEFRQIECSDSREICTSLPRVNHAL